MAEDSSSTSSRGRPQVPPGMVIGPDGKPCKACTSGANFKAWSKSMKGTGIGATTAATTILSQQPTECPPDLEALGRSTWTFLHTTASYYPSSPSPFQKRQMLNLLNALPSLYPCHICADHLGETMKSHPADNAVNTREGVMDWLCRRHNEVNVRLGKEEFDCGIKNLDERWKDGPQDGRCD